MPINEITPVHIQKYLNELVEHGYGYSTIKKQLRIVSSVLFWRTLWTESPVG